ncbi:LacI family transcriptional regulator [Eubacteriales bacterium OttesenSCG-928-K08]|nr:LacI family transcriptional regulator [Eubacteriales bacterium OttesenSCG-928-K08]
MMKRVTLKDIANVANVSFTTVSRALAGNPEINEETRKHILQISRDMGYVGSKGSRRSDAISGKTIGLLVNNIRSPFTAEVAFHIEQHAWAQGYTLLMSHTVGKRQMHGEVYRILFEKAVDGIISMPAHEMVYDDIKHYLAQVPTVFINEDLQGRSESYVTIDNYKGSYIGTEYLLSLGHKKIIYCGRASTKVSRQLRLKGYIEACEAYGCTPQHIEYPYGVDSTQCGYMMGKEIFTRPRDFTAIFAATDTTAFGLMRAAAEIGVRIPEDVSLIGFDNVDLSGMPGIALTTIDQPKEAIAGVAVNMLLEKIKYPAIESSHRLLNPSLVVRESCRQL